MNGFIAIVSNLLGWAGCFALAGAIVGIGLYCYRAWKGTAERGQSPVWMSADAWLTPSRVVLASVVVLFVILSVLFQQTPWTTMLLTALLATCLVGMMPPQYKPARWLSCLLAPLPLVVGLAANLLLSPGFLAFAAASLVAAALMRALIGVPDAVYYGQQSGATAKPKHLVWPGRDSLRKILTENVHGQTAANVQVTDVLDAAASLCSPASKRPGVISLPGPESCGRRRLAEVLAGALQGPFIQPNDRLDATGDAFYAGCKALRFNGHGCVLFLEGVETSPKGAQFLADVILRGHPENDDWSKVLIIIPITVSANELPAGADQKTLADALGGKIERRLLAASTIIPMAALDPKGKAKVATQVAIDLGRLNGVEIRSVDKDALFKLVSEADKEIEGANSVRIAVDHALHRRLETAQLRGLKAADVRLGADGDYELVPIPA